MNCRFCKKEFTPEKVPCPDKIENCVVPHTTETSHLCPHCHKDNSNYAWDEVFYSKPKS